MGLLLLPNIKLEHIQLTPFSRMRVEVLAAQLLSETVAKALVLSGDPAVQETAKFVTMLDKFFDSLNVFNYTLGVNKRKGVFMKLFRLLEVTCHQFGLQLAYTYQEESSSSSSFTKYTEELYKLQVARAKLAEAQDSLAALEEAVMYVVVAYGEESPVTDILIRHALDRRQSVEKMEMEIAKTTKVTSKEFALHDDPFVKELDEAIQSFKVQRQQYFGGVFVGNHIHKTLII
ncbi:hypothetical protein EMCRGX_G002131 [Ephydatia muelleri]